MNRFRMPTFGFAMVLVALSAVLIPPTGAIASTCDRGSCNARITTSVWTGQPTLDCTQNPEVFAIKIVVVVCCPGACSSTNTFYRCSTSSESYQFSACGLTHTVSLNSATWGDAHEDAEPILYSAQ